MRALHRESKRQLGLVVASPVIWSIHFLASYAFASVWCAKVAGRNGSLFEVRLVIAGLTAIGLTGIFLAGRAGYRRHRVGRAKLPHDSDTALDRRRFLGYAAYLLSLLSGVAVLYSALAAVFIGSCR
jgi:hypothetical protein